MINVTKTYLPPFEEYIQLLKRAWDKAWITNNGELVQELEAKLKKYLGVNYLLFCNNGTVVLQMALKAYDIMGEVITTPFSYVATTNVLLWENCSPVFVDIDPLTFCIDANKIEAAITENTQAILATHVYGYPCDVEKIEALALKHNLKVIYDAAHAFGTTYKGKSVLNFGDISTCSFHATKIFHTVEGGCIISHDKDVNNTLDLMRSFGHRGDEHYGVGINGKNSEFHAAMGLANFKYLNNIISDRKRASNLYDEFLKHLNLKRPHFSVDVEYNYAYYPVVFESESVVLQVIKHLSLVNIIPRRYFFPSLNKIPQTIGLNQNCLHSEDVALRTLCLPLYHDMQETDIINICKIITNTVL